MMYLPGSAAAIAIVGSKWLIVENVYIDFTFYTIISFLY